MQEIPKKYNYDPEEENLFRELLNKYLPYWPLFLLLLAIGISGSYIYLRYKVPIYEAKATILIKDEKKGIDEDKILENLDLFGPKKIVENEVEVIQSRTIAREVVKNLHLYAPITSEGKIASRSAYLLSPVSIEAQNFDSIAPAKKIYFHFTGRKMEFDKNSYPLNSWVNTPYGMLRFTLNPLYRPADENKPMYFSLLDPKAATADLLNNLKVSASSKQSTVINLSYQDEVPKRAEAILNELITVYNNAAIRDKNSLAANTLSFVEDRLKYVVQELDSVEGSLERFRTRNKLVDISAQGQLYLQTVGANDQKISDIDMQLAVLNQVENYVLGKTKKGSIVPSTLGVDDPVLSQLLEKLYNSELEYEKLKPTTAENNPMLIALRDAMEKIRPNILENIRNQRKSLEAGKGNLAGTNGKYSSLLNTIPQKERELLEISRQQSIKNNIYTFLLQKREETALSYASTVADSRIVDTAEAGSAPVSPKRSLIYLIGIAGALALGIGFVSLKEVINNSILFRTEIEKYTSVPILGEVLFDASKKPIVISEGKRSFVAEQFRQLRTSLGYLGINSRRRKILITSTISGEGKSFITANLGVSLALMGKKVVLVELDLRKPKLSAALNVSRTPGLTNYFIGNKDVEEIIKSTELNANLFIVPAGPIPPNPSELILNGKVQELFTYLETHFDYVLVDTSPINPVTDAYILSPMCDATLFIVRHGVTPKSFVQKMDEQNKIKELKNMAIIFNGVKERGFGAYGYGYGSGYGYGYGYGYTDEGKKKGRKKKKVESMEGEV